MHRFVARKLKVIMIPSKLFFLVHAFLRRGIGVQLNEVFVNKIGHGKER